MPKFNLKKVRDDFSSLKERISSLAFSLISKSDKHIKAITSHFINENFKFRIAEDLFLVSHLLSFFLISLINPCLKLQLLQTLITRIIISFVAELSGKSFLKYLFKSSLLRFLALFTQSRPWYSKYLLTRFLNESLDFLSLTPLINSESICFSI